MESLILISGLILFSGTVTFDLHHNALDVQKADTAKTTVQVEKSIK